MPPEPTHSAGAIALRLAAVLLLVLANGFFVAAEFALVGARRTRIEALARQGNRRARAAGHAMENLAGYLPATQLGITLASLALGWVGEETVAELLRGWFAVFHGSLGAFLSHTVATILAFLVITFLHIVLGELAPKAMALISPEGTSLWTAQPLIWFSKLLKPFIWFLNKASTAVLGLLGLKPPSEAERVHRPEEIEMLLTQSYEHGYLSEEPVEMIRGVFDLSETTAAEVMTPRTDLVAVPDTASVLDVARVIVDEGHSRIPVFHGSVDNIVGVVVARDVWRAQWNGEPALPELIRRVPFVPETKSVEDLLGEMQTARIHMAVVVDEFGGTAGVVTIEDLIEQIVGDISDEHEEAEPASIEEVGPGQYRVSGALPIEELNDDFEFELPGDHYTTVAGFVLGELGRIAREGDEVAFRGGRFRVEAMSGRRIERLGLTLVEPEPEPEEE